MTAPAQKLSHASLQQAAHWYVQLQDENAAPQLHTQWQHWFDQHGDHQAAWHYVQRVGQRFAPLQAEGAPAGRALREHDARRFSRRTGLKSLLVLGASSLLGWRAWHGAPLSGWDADMATGIGEIRETRLADGSQLWLGAQSAVDLEFSTLSRVLKLRFGELLVETAHDPRRPFFVDTAQGRMQALGTRFAVCQQGERTRLDVYAGAVEVCTAQSGERCIVAAGQQVDFSARGISNARPAQSAGESWIYQRLNAEDMPLAHLLQTLGRYRHGHLGWHPNVAKLSVMGAFPLNDTDRALALLQAALPVRVQRLTPWWITVEPA
ncbi:FecR domain-containing protein [Pseudomonas putida]|uniref:FecR domain-containing protein n=1 Tax=Pseudomonas putida TaxID=303 RepID=A0AAW6PSU4_PSEPU|nr:FecR domain-containing protein [Pseudomonas putida]MCE0961334.1 FecR domain-containing protein [Pseudomonas putida]MCE0973214.1 FecR domain-containing protein [Pseudomonas putida]MDD2121596.1 FecR domain-containing protein [Pseudomonas putida]MDF3872495.1 FecR domain-containing protein [Pseudomonas putida]MDF3878676.1 FecR domain-containing protein [Pseudomonas putida]